MVKPKRTRHYYKDFMTGKRHYTHGQFGGWRKLASTDTWCALFVRRSSEIFVPIYLLERKTLAQLPPRPNND